MSGYDPGYLGIFREIMAPDPSDKARYLSHNHGLSANNLPEGRMWTQVLMEAIKDLFRPVRPAFHHDALSWVESERHHAGSFRYVCEALGLDPGATRRRLLDTLTALGGSGAVLPARAPKNRIPGQPRSHHRRALPSDVARTTPPIDLNS